MNPGSPRVSIGMPVYNGERYLATAIESILAQTFPDFELIISDNASTDRTEEICRSYATRDTRIRYYRNEQNLGSNRNFNQAFGLATCPYFMWAAHDDLRAPDFVARCVNALDANPDVVLAYSKTTSIDENGDPLPDFEKSSFRTNSLRPSIRFHDLVRSAHWCFQVLGMFRASVLAQTLLLGAYTSADYVLLAELGLRGKFYEVPEALTFYRHHTRQSVHLDRHARMAWSGSTIDARLSLPQWRLCFELWASIQRVPLSRSERLRCYLSVLRWPFWYPNWRRMGKDVLVALLFLLGSTLRLARGLKNWKRSRSPSA